MTPLDAHPFPHPCRGLDLTYPAIEANLALDEALLLAAEERGLGPVLRLWEPDALAVVLGASCRLHDDVDLDACRADGVPVARRSSGGGTVLVGPGTLNLAVVLPSDAAPGLDAVDTAQSFVLERTAGALRRRDVPVEVRGHGDLTLGDRKFAGSAQRRLRRHFLVHVTLMYRFPPAPIARYTRNPRRQPAYRQLRGHDAFLTNLDLPRSEIVAAVRSAWTTPGRELDPSEVPEQEVRRLVREKFGDPDWVYRL